MDESLPDFTGRVVVVQMMTPLVSLALADARYERHLGKLYLVGRQVGSPQFPNWADGATHYIAPEHMAFFAVFDSLDLYLSRLAAHPYQPAPADAPQPRRGWFGRGA